MRRSLPVLVRRFARCLIPAAAIACIWTTGKVVAQVPQAVRKTIQTRLAAANSEAIDTGSLPSSQRVVVTLTLAADDRQLAALDQFLVDVATPSSPSYRQWLTPQEFASRFGVAPDRLASLSSWVVSQGLRVDGISPSGMRMSISGFTPQIETAFATPLHHYLLGGVLYFANVTLPTLPIEAGLLVMAVEGLDNLPPSINLQSEVLTVDALGAIVDANASAILGLDTSGSGGTLSASQVTGLSAVFRQAAAQGITTLIYSSAANGGLSAGFADATLVVSPSFVAGIGSDSFARPVWQFAAGLPADGLRDVPDLSAASLDVLVHALTAVSLETGGRLGNVAATLYALAPTPGLFTQPDGALADTWEPATGLGLVDVARLVKAFPHGAGTSTLQVTSSFNAPTHGQSFFLTVNSTTTNGGGGPTGTVTFTAPQAAFTPSSVTLNANGTAQSQNYLLPGGTYSITAAYSGDASYGQTSSMVTVTVQPEAAIFTITAPASVSLGGNITATVTLTSPSGFGTPSGSVLVTPSGITGAQPITQPVTGTGGTASASYAFTTKQAGSVALQASCTSTDASFSCYTPQTSTTTVPQATPTVTLAMTPTNPTAGNPVTLSSTVSGIAGIGPTGSVQFFDGNTSLGFGSAPAATYTGNLNPGSTHVLTAVYQGDSNYLKATSPAITTSVARAATTTSVNPSANMATFGQSITLNITVATTTVVNGTQPTGTLTFTGAGSTTTAAVSGGSANVTLNNLPVGTFTIGTSYSGDTNYSSSTGNTIVLTVTQATAGLSTSLSSTSFTTGSSSTLTVTVTLPGNASLPSGATFIASIIGIPGASYTGTFAVNTGGNTGTGSVTIPAPIAGSYQMQVLCGTNPNFTCTPSTLSIISTATGPGSTGTTVTTTALAISPVAPAIGQSVTLTATVSAAASATAANPLAGTVNFYDGTTLLGNGMIAVAGTNAVAVAKVLLTSSTSAHSLTATYAGNTIYASSTSAVISVTPTASAAGVVLTSNISSGIAGTSIVFNATVTGTAASGSVTTSGSPTGTVSFYITGAAPALIGTATLGSLGPGVGLAVFSTSNLPAGSQGVYAIYIGDANFGSATSNTITLGVSDYAVSFVPQTLTMARGQTATATGVVTLINAFPGTVVFGCTPAPNTEMTCSFNPQVLKGGGATILAVTTTLPKSQSISSGQRASLRVVGGLAFASLMCWIFPIFPRRRLPTLLLGMLAFGLFINLGCSSNSFNSPISLTNTGTPLGTTLLNITTVGTDVSNTVRHNFTYQVTIQ